MNAGERSMNGEQIYRRIKADILDFSLQPGTLISENELAKKYNVSRTPVKSAFLRLMSEKFIEIEPQRGTYVTMMDLNQIRDIIYMRTVLEREIFCAVIDHMDEGLLATLKDNIDKQHTLVAQGQFEPAMFYRLDSDFHRAAFEHEGRHALWEIIQEFQVYYTRFRMLDIIANSSFPQLLKEHELLLETIERGDKQALSEQLKAHLSGNLKRLEPRIETEFSAYFLPKGNHIRR